MTYHECPCCHESTESSGLGWWMLFNPVVWLFGTPLYAPKTCRDCADALTLGGIVFVALALAAVFLIAVLTGFA